MAGIGSVEISRTEWDNLVGILTGFAEVVLVERYGQTRKEYNMNFKDEHRDVIIDWLFKNFMKPYQNPIYSYNYTIGPNKQFSFSMEGYIDND